jgi:hypothetical protein
MRVLLIALGLLSVMVVASVSFPRNERMCPRGWWVDQGEDIGEHVPCRFIRDHKAQVYPAPPYCNFGVCK